MALRAIETRYAGHLFRSRLEARWAVFFDAMNLQWRYETEGYYVPSGRYLPDFWLPEGQVWIEVKGAAPTKKDQRKFLEFGKEAASQGHRCRLLQGDIPRSVANLNGLVLTGMTGQQSSPLHELPGIFVQVPTPDYLVVHQEGNAPQLRDDGTPRFDLEDQAETPIDHWRLTPSVWIPGHAANTINAALTAARSARFEYGHSGATL